MLTVDFDRQGKRKKKPPSNMGHYYGSEDVVSRVRSVIRSAKIRQQMLQDGKEPSFMRDKANEMKFWKTVFDRYDVDNSGALDFEEITEVVRNDLKIAERTLTKVELRDFYSHLDENDDQVVDWHEWLSFVSQGKLRDNRPIDQVMAEVGRAVRTSLRRLGLKPCQVEDRVRAEASDTVDQVGFFRIFRKGLRINRQDCSDDNLKRTFASIADGALHMRLQPILDFLQISCLAKTNKEIGMGTTFPGLVGGMRGILPARMPKNRPGTFPLGGTVSGPTTVPFALNGRRLPPSSRLAVDMRPHERQRRPLRPSMSCPDLQNNNGVTDVNGCHLSEKTLAALEAAMKEDEPPPAPPTSPVAATASRQLDRGKFASNNSRISKAPDAAEQERPVSATSKAFGKAFEAAMDAAKDAKAAVSDPFAIFLKVSAQAENSRKPVPVLPKRPARQTMQESYRVIVGKDALNRVEQQLLEAGVDMRGAYHRTGR